MEFTALHQATGREPGPITEDLLEEAVAAGVEESDALDWKRELPGEKSLRDSDFAKDIAAMANSGGGVIVFGVAEEQRAASGRIDCGQDVTETYERTMRRIASSGIQPPVTGLGIHRFGEEPRRAVILVVPASVEGPHLVYRGTYFGAPIRNHADTDWMSERQLEASYRARFDARLAADRALADLYGQIATGRAVERAWMFGVARPRVAAGYRGRLSRDDARSVVQDAFQLAPMYADTNGRHPIEDVNKENPRPGLRRWVAPTTAERASSAWKEAWATVHDDGSVTLAAAVGAAPNRDGHDPAWLVHAGRAERFVGDLMALLRASSNLRGTEEYEVKIGVEWPGEQPLVIQTTDQFGLPLPEVSVPLARYVPVMASVRTDVGTDGFKAQIWDLASDVVNQGGIQYLKAIEPPAG